MPTPSPFLLAPWFSLRPWGCESLRPWYPVDSPGDPIGEAWLTGPESRVDSGEFRGTTLAALLRTHGADILGAAHAHGDEYPLLIKLIFPRERLSIQVHPDDATAQRLGFPRGKTECWYVLAAQPGASVQLGLNNGATPETIREAIRDNTLERWLRAEPVTQGDMVYVDAGTVHAIGPGVVLLETQQQSDVTFRMYDYGRPRPLHVDESLASLRAETQAGKVPPQHISQNVTELITNDFFRVTEHRLQPGDSVPLAALDRPRTLFLARGDAALNELSLVPNHVAIIPAGYAQATLSSDAGAHVLEMLPGPRV